MMKMAMQYEQFRTTDFQTVVYLYARFKIVPSITWVDANRAEFTFTADVDFQKASQDFLKGVKDIPPLRMFDAISRIRSLLHSSKQNKENYYENGNENKYVNRYSSR